MSIAEKLTTIAENEQRVFEAGKTAEWNELWDGYQACGGRTDYRWSCIAGNFIVDKDTTPRWNFKPKYDVKVKIGNGMFRGFNAATNGGVYKEDIYIDLVQWFDDLGVEFNTSNLTDAQAMFYNAQGIKRIPVINLSKCTAANTTANFIGQIARVVTIDGIISSENTVWYSTTFDGNNPLSHCIFSGVIGKNFYISNAKNLDKESIISVINTLSETTSDLTATLSKTAVTKAFGSTESEEWLNLTATKPNWTISLK